MKLLQICVEGNTGSTGTIAESIGQFVIKKGWESYIAYGRFPRPSKSKLIHIGTNLEILLHGLETRIVRIFNTYGPRMRVNDGRVLPAFIGQALRGEDLTMFGDGSQTRAFCFVNDLVEGIYRLLLSDYTQPMNIGNPDEITIKEFGEEIIKLTGTTQKLISLPLPTDDPKQRKPDITKAKAILGWEPKVSRAEGLKITYEYFKSLSPEDLHRMAHHKEF